MGDSGCFVACPYWRRGGLWLGRPAAPYETVTAGGNNRWFVMHVRHVERRRTTGVLRQCLVGVSLRLGNPTSTCLWEPGTEPFAALWVWWWVRSWRYPY
jgi:hypothetical protein